VIASLLLAAALVPAPSTPHELTTALGLGVRVHQPIFVVSWTGRRRWGAWLRLDSRKQTFDSDLPAPEGVPVSTNAGSIGVAWRAWPRLTLGLGYGEMQEKVAQSGGTTPTADPLKEEWRGVAAIATWTFSVNEDVGVAVSASGGPGGFGAAVGGTFFFP